MTLRPNRLGLSQGCDGRSTPFPLRLFRHSRAFAFLGRPEIKQFGSTPEIVLHGQAKPSLEVLFPCRVERICFTLDFRMASNRSVAGVNQFDQFSLAILTCNHCAEHPISQPLPNKVSILYPCERFTRVSPTCPFPKPFPDEVIHLSKDGLRHLVPMIVRPSPNKRIKPCYHCFLLRCFGLIDYRPDFPQKRLHVLFRRFDEKLSHRSCARSIRGNQSRL